MQAEEIMRKLEKEEEILSYDDPDKKVFHLCIVNLVIGTLYCSKSNYQVCGHNSLLIYYSCHIFS
jgi:tetratricopeptide repeat protein 30